ncbi:MAG: DUF4861 family protein [Rikenellaceae bacterium]
MQKINLFSLLLLLLASCSAGQKTLIITNGSSVARQSEVIEIDIDDADQYVILDENGVAQECQTTYQGKLIFAATVGANAQAKYTLTKGERPELETIATGRTYSEWHNNFAWENDKIGYRVYSKDIASTGSELFGFDIFTKRSRTPVLDILFETQFDEEYQRLRRENKEIAASLTAAISIHIDHGLGMDYYAVGPTLGSGTPALMSDGEIVYPGFFDNVEVLDQGGLRHTFRMTLEPRVIDGEQVTEIRTITLDAGSHFNHIVVEYQGLTKTTDAVIGIVLHDEGENQSAADGYIAYAEPKHAYGWQTYNAIIFPADMARETTLFDEPTAGALGHLLAKGVYTPGETFSYHMGAGWNRWGFPTAQDWFEHVAQQQMALQTPLSYTIK